jgi:hypothetical protein
MSLEALFLVVLAAVLLGVYPSWPYSRDWGYGPFILLLLIFGLLLVLTLMGYVPRLEYGEVVSHGNSAFYSADRGSAVTDANGIAGSAGPHTSMMRFSITSGAIVGRCAVQPTYRWCLRHGDRFINSNPWLSPSASSGTTCRWKEARRTDKFLADGFRRHVVGAPLLRRCSATGAASRACVGPPDLLRSLRAGAGRSSRQRREFVFV